MKRIAPLFCLSLAIIGLSGCGLTPKDSVLKKPGQARPAIQIDSSEVVDTTQLTLAKAEELYAAGVTANLESNWSAAQESFEKSLEILYLMPVDENDSVLVDKYNRLLREIAFEYKNTLVYLGELEDDTSQIIFFERI